MSHHHVCRRVWGECVWEREERTSSVPRLTTIRFGRAVARILRFLQQRQQQQQRIAGGQQNYFLVLIHRRRRRLLSLVLRALAAAMCNEMRAVSKSYFALQKPKWIIKSNFIHVHANACRL